MTRSCKEPTRFYKSVLSCIPERATTTPRRTRSEVQNAFLCAPRVLTPADKLNQMSIIRSAGESDWGKLLLKLQKNAGQRSLLLSSTSFYESCGGGGWCGWIFQVSVDQRTLLNQVNVPFLIWLLPATSSFGVSCQWLCPSQCGSPQSISQLLLTKRFCDTPPPNCRQRDALYVTGAQVAPQGCCWCVFRWTEWSLEIDTEFIHFWANCKQQ